ncbi:hypothetical protein PGTUg99_003940 [Puccinia graminis f. sp. tritici]|uniref:Secreted protein n=1 Tax=Puccinia graminis f. sp. tritici TaxID=56615 RepID=A0A5B0MRP1_PUCGR|nr:hypothetical protein PGTUg99_003940 [Puccinia graminis f. sp. tritici]
MFRILISLAFLMILDAFSVSTLPAMSEGESPFLKGSELYGTLGCRGRKAMKGAASDQVQTSKTSPETAPENLPIPVEAIPTKVEKELALKSEPGRSRPAEDMNRAGVHQTPETDPEARQQANTPVHHFKPRLVLNDSDLTE